MKEHLTKRVEELAIQIKESPKGQNQEPIEKLENLMDKTFPLIRYILSEFETHKLTKK